MAERSGRFRFAYGNARAIGARIAGRGLESSIMSGRILVVEDDPTMAEVLVAYLRRAGYQTEWTGDGSEALLLWQRLQPDVVILDLMLPGTSGLELLRRRRPDADQAAVIILSARGEEEDRLIGLETGADDYVVKPFSPARGGAPGRGTAPAGRTAVRHRPAEPSARGRRPGRRPGTATSDVRGS